MSFWAQFWGATTQSNSFEILRFFLVFHLGRDRSTWPTVQARILALVRDPPHGVSSTNSLNRCTVVVPCYGGGGHAPAGASGRPPRGRPGQRPTEQASGACPAAAGPPSRGPQTTPPEPNFWRKKRDVRQKVGSSCPLEPSPTLQGITRFSW